jgi:hypothetical protein
MTEKAALTFITHRTTTGSEKQDPTAIFLYFKNIKKYICFKLIFFYF